MNSAVRAKRRLVYVNRKQILSLFGIVPLGVYVVLHLWTNLQSLGGPDAFDQAVRESRHVAGHENAHPGYIFLEVFGLGVPLLAHTLLGLRELLRSRPNNVKYPTFDNLKYLLQRLSAIGLALFIGAHVWKARLFPTDVKDGHESWMGMHEGLSEPVTFVIYLLGLLGVSYHLANGLQTASLRWGLVATPAGQRRVQTVSIAAFVILLAMSYASVWGFKPFQKI